MTATHEIPPVTESFSDAYRTLRACAEAIEAAAEDDLDTVIAEVERAKRAKEICESRLRAASERLQQLLDSPQSGATTA